MKDILFVKGNIIVKSGDHQVKEVIAYATNKWQELSDKIIEGDLIITDKDELMPYSIYCASEDITTYEKSDIGALQRPEDVIRIYQEEINNLLKLKNQDISADLSNAFNRQIYIGVVGTMELFLSDFLFSMVLGTRKYFNKFCENSARTFKLKEISNKKWRIQDGVVKTILETNYHQINTVSKIYEKVLNLKFFSLEKLEAQILTRHSLVHRNGYPSKDSRYIKIDHQMIDDLITEVQKLADHIIESKKTEIEDWYPNPEQIK